MNELNAKVAVILGWTKSVSGIFWRSPGDARRRANPQFDTDPALLPEMLAWLKGKCTTAQRLALTDIEGGCWLACVEEMDDMAREYDVAECESGNSLNEAVARLVVAVAEEKP